MTISKTGISITGVLKGYYETQNGTYTNCFLAIITGDYTNEFGDTVENIQKVELSTTMAPMFKQQAEQYSGQAVRLWVGQDLKHGVKGGRPWAFIKTFVRKDTSIEPLDSKSSNKAA